jgi:hypothetical protein
MASENPLWGTERIRGELLKLGIAVSPRSIRRYRRRRHSRPPSQSWRTFLANHSQAIWAADLFVVQTLTFQTLYVLFFIGHGSRQPIHFEVTDHPTAAWAWRQLIEATPWNRRPHYLIHDRDRVWGADLKRRTSTWQAPCPEGYQPGVVSQPPPADRLEILSGASWWHSVANASSRAWLHPWGYAADERPTAQRRSFEEPSRHPS